MEPVWNPYVQSKEVDNWTVVPDAATRKKIQNQMAQRAHRAKYGRKLAPKKDKTAAPSTASGSEQALSRPSQPKIPATEIASQARAAAQDVLAEQIRITATLLQALSNQQQIQSEQTTDTATPIETILNQQNVVSEHTELNPLTEPSSSSETIP